jgi:selenocysteine lyase/cysteine desulfurase
MEYAGNAVAFLQLGARTGVSVEVIPMREDGIVDLCKLEQTLQTPPAGAHGRVVVALTHVNTNSSIVQPAATVGALCSKYEALYLLDACQSIGQLPVDVQAIGCDFACGTGRKWLRGPRGTGFLYARKETINRSGRYSLVGEPPMVDHTSAHWISPFAYELAPDARR